MSTTNFSMYKYICSKNELGFILKLLKVMMKKNAYIKLTYLLTSGKYLDFSLACHLTAPLRIFYNIQNINKKIRYKK